MNTICRSSFAVVVAVAMVGCGKQGGLRAHSGGDAAMGAGGGTSPGSSVGIDAALSGGAGGTSSATSAGTGGGVADAGNGGVGGTVSGGNSGSGRMDGGSSGGSAGGNAGRSGGAGAGGGDGVGGSSSGGALGGNAGRSGGTGGPGQGGDSGAAGSTSGGGGGRTGGTGGPAAGGNVGAGGSSSGGRGGAGGRGSAGDSGGAGGIDGGGGASGILASGYCTGDSPKVTYLGQDATAPATNYQSGLVFDCCYAVGVNLHSRATLGLDLDVEVIMSGTPADGEYTVDGSTFGLRASVHADHESALPVHLANGSVRIAGNPYGTQAWELGLCLEVDDEASPLVGTRIYVPSVTMCPYYSWQNRLQLYLLQDASLTAYDAGKLALGSLTLAATPLLDLGSIAYVEQATGRVGLNPGQKIGTSLRSTLGQVDMYGLPFVVVADDVRIYLGSFMSPISSVTPTGPWVQVDDAGTEGITENGFVIQPPRGSGPDPRNDPRIIQVLTEAGKLVP